MQAISYTLLRVKNGIKNNNKLQLKPQENHAVHPKAININKIPEACTEVFEPPTINRISILIYKLYNRTIEKYQISVVRIVPASV